MISSILFWSTIIGIHTVQCQFVSNGSTQNSVYLFQSNTTSNFSDCLPTPIPANLTIVASRLPSKKSSSVDFLEAVRVLVDQPSCYRFHIKAENVSNLNVTTVKVFCQLSRIISVVQHAGNPQVIAEFFGYPSGYQMELPPKCYVFANRFQFQQKTPHSKNVWRLQHTDSEAFVELQKETLPVNHTATSCNCTLLHPFIETLWSCLDQWSKDYLNLHSLLTMPAPDNFSMTSGLW